MSKINKIDPKTAVTFILHLGVAAYLILRSNVPISFKESSRQVALPGSFGAISEPKNESTTSFEVSFIRSTQQVERKTGQRLIFEGKSQKMMNFETRSLNRISSIIYEKTLKKGLKSYVGFVSQRSTRISSQVKLEKDVIILIFKLDLFLQQKKLQQNKGRRVDTKLTLGQELNGDLNGQVYILDTVGEHGANQSLRLEILKIIN